MSGSSSTLLATSLQGGGCSPSLDGSGGGDQGLGRAASISGFSA